MFLDHAGEKGRAAHRAYMDLVGSMIWFNTRPGLLSKLRRDYDVLDDDTVANGKIDAGALRTRGERYKAIIVPSAWLIESPTLAKLVAFAAAGGRLIVVGALPEATDRPEGAGDIERLRKLVAEGRAVLLEGGVDERRLDAALSPLPREIETDSPALLRRDGDVSMLFLTAAPEGSATKQPMLSWAIWDYDHDVFQFAKYNTALREEGYDLDPQRNRPTARVRIAGPVGAIEQWDPATGAVKPVATAARDGTIEAIVDFSQSPMSVLVWSASGEGASAPLTEAPATSFTLPDVWQSTIVPTIDNRYGDFTLPAAPGPLPVQAWTLSYREDAATAPDASWRPDDWARVPVTDGLRGWLFGPSPSHKLPDPLVPKHAGTLSGPGWAPLHYSLSRGIDHDYAHDKTLGPKGRVPEEFWRVRSVTVGEAVQLRTTLPAPAGELALAIGANGNKTVWWNGEQLPPDVGAYLYLQPVRSNGEANVLEVRVEAIADDDLAGYWALTTDRDAFERPEWLQPSGAGKAGTTFVMSRTVELSAGETFEAQFASQGVATLLVNGNEVAMHGAFDPYANWQAARIIRYDLTPYVHPGDNTVEVRFTDIGMPMAMLFDGIVSSRSSNQSRSIISDASWQGRREGLPVALAFQPMQRNDPRYALLKPRPHPLPRTGWLDPEQPLAGVLDIVPEPRPGEPKRNQWFSLDVPPGATALRLPARDADLAVFDNGQELPVDGSRVPLPAGARARRILIRARVDDGRSGGAVWDGPIEFEIGEGEIGLGPWATQGLEFYSGCVAYRQVVDVDDPARWRAIDLGHVRGTAELEVNGVAIGARVWSPYRFDVSGKLKTGANVIVVRVFNTLAPYLKGASPTHSIFKGQDVSGLMGPVRLISEGQSART
jgi:hypothetical protein